METSPGRLKGNFRLYLFSSLIADAILPFYAIFLPLFASTLSATPLEIGLVGGASNAVYTFMPVIMGHFSDRRGSRRFFIISAFSLLCAVSLLYSVLDSPLALIVSRILEGVGWAMLWPALEAGVTQEPGRNPKKSLSTLNYVWTFGAALGPIVGTFLVTGLSYRLAFAMSGVAFLALILANLVPVLAEWRKKRASTARHSSEFSFEGIHGIEASEEKVTLYSSILSTLRSGDHANDFQVWTCLASTAVSAGVYGILFTFFGTYAKSSLGISVLLIGGIITAFGFVRFSMFLGLSRESLRLRLFEPRKRVRNVLLSLAVVCSSSLIFLVRDPSGDLYFVAFTLFAAGYGLVYVISQGTLIAEASSENIGSAAGIFESSIGLGGAVGPIIGGIVSEASISFSFLLPIIGYALVIALLYPLSRRISRKS